MRRRTGIAFLAITALLLTGCVWQGRPSAEASADVGDEMRFISSGPETPGPEPVIRGTVEKSVGEVFEVVAAEGPLARFTVTELTVDAPCSAASSRDPKNGHFVRIEIEGATNAELTRTLSFGEGAWSAVASGGGAVDRGIWTSASVACAAESEQFPTSVGADTAVTGAVVLDVTSDHGTIALEVAPGLSWTWSY